MCSELLPEAAVRNSTQRTGEAPRARPPSRFHCGTAVSPLGGQPDAAADHSDQARASAESLAHGILGSKPKWRAEFLQRRQRRQLTERTFACDKKHAEVVAER